MLYPVLMFLSHIYARFPSVFGLANCKYDSFLGVFPVVLLQYMYVTAFLLIIFIN